MSLKEQLAEYRAGWHQRVPAERQARSADVYSVLQ
jgi:hypothetical protein